MGHTFGDRFLTYDLEVQHRLRRRFKAVAVTLCERYDFYDLEPDDLVQEAFKAIVPREYDLNPNSGPITLIWRIIERKLIDEKRRRRPVFFHELGAEDCEEEDEDDQANASDSPDAVPNSEQQLINREVLLAFISETTSMVALLESVLNTRRRDFRTRVRNLFDAFCSDPGKYVYHSERGNSGIRIRASELAADLGWSENAYQQFKARVDSVLADAGLSVDRILLGIFVHDEAVRLGLAPKPLQIGF